VSRCATSLSNHSTSQHLTLRPAEGKVSRETTGTDGSLRNTDSGCLLKLSVTRAQAGGIHPANPLVPSPAHLGARTSIPGRSGSTRI
jgi:hypothetical protein